MKLTDIIANNMRPRQWAGETSGKIRRGTSQFIYWNLLSRGGDTEDYFKERTR